LNGKDIVHSGAAAYSPCAKFPLASRSVKAQLPKMDDHSFVQTAGIGHVGNSADVKEWVVAVYQPSE
jgi:hypothetical protein